MSRKISDVVNPISCFAGLLRRWLGRVFQWRIRRLFVVDTSLDVHVVRRWIRLPSPRVLLMRFDPGFYRTRRWRDVRYAYLAAHPTCSVPGCSDPAVDVDHANTRRSGAGDYEGLSSMCKSHHSAKTVALDGGFGRAPAPSYTPTVRGCDASGTPKDKSHHWHVGPSP
jgi:hypothetical protein